MGLSGVAVIHRRFDNAVIRRRFNTACLIVTDLSLCQCDVLQRKISKVLFKRQISCQLTNLIYVRDNS